MISNMTNTSKITPITINDVAFTVTRQIEHCPKTMMLRELFVNAVEAAEQAPENKKIVEIKGKFIPEFQDVRKLAIWNTGPGMTSQQLSSICDLAASMGKNMALDGNFGMGAKVASLPSNTMGMRYRSCKDGTVSEVLLGKRDGVYGRIHRFVDEKVEEVIDATDMVIEEDEYSLEEDWTEVVLFGCRPEQDTVSDPYNNNPKQDKQWITTGLYHRIYNLPEGVAVYLGEGTHPRDGKRQFKTIPDRSDSFGRVETVDVENGIKIHYLYDPAYQDSSHNKSISGSLTSSLSTCAIIQKGEMYDVRKSRKWTCDAPAFGIPFGARHISIHIEISDNYPVRGEPYRRFLQYAEGDQRTLEVEEFSDLVFENRPEWLIEVIKDLAPNSSASANDLRKELQKFLNNLKVRSASARITKSGDVSVESGGTRGAVETKDGKANGDNKNDNGKVDPMELLQNPKGAKRAKMAMNLEQAPEIIPLRAAELVEEKGIQGKAALYIQERNQLFVNMMYTSVDETAQHLENRYASHNDRELVQTFSKEWAEKLLMSRVGYAVVYGQAKHLSKAWSPDDVKKALEPECLSLAADAWRDAVSGVYQSMSRRLGATTSKTDDDSEYTERQVA